MLGMVGVGCWVLGFGGGGGGWSQGEDWVFDNQGSAGYSCVSSIACGGQLRRSIATVQAASTLLLDCMLFVGRVVLRELLWYIRDAEPPTTQQPRHRRYWARAWKTNQKKKREHYTQIPPDCLPPGRLRRQHALAYCTASQHCLARLCVPVRMSL